MLEALASIGNHNSNHNYNHTLKWWTALKLKYRGAHIRAQSKTVQYRGHLILLWKKYPNIILIFFLVKKFEINFIFWFSHKLIKSLLDCPRYKCQDSFLPPLTAILTAVKISTKDLNQPITVCQPIKIKCKFSPANLWVFTEPIKMPEIIKFCNFLNFLEFFVILNLFLFEKFSFFAD